MPLAHTTGLLLLILLLIEPRKTLGTLPLLPSPTSYSRKPFLMTRDPS
ncbi:hypothetical protein J1605_017481 [Eschrichtius robustus]|uniref:Uncharacterized protein n=1 Tax=Eschrichtius robustus TaxID=9764 RepID=A0AB34HYQ1_ESCRO|nr:hypothetical protein J1605_017481 [Eschrichtius robustus]